MPEPRAARQTALPRDASDAALLTRIAQNDVAAYDAVFTAYAPVLCRIAYSYLRHAERAEEIAQDVLLTLWQRRTTLTLRGTLRSYLYASTRHRALNAVRDARVADRHHHDLTNDEGIVALSEPARLASDAVADQEIRHALRHAIAELPDRCRETFLLRWRANLSYTEIAQVMGVSVKAVEMQRQRAFAILRKKLARFLS